MPLWIVGFLEHFGIAYIMQTNMHLLWSYVMFCKINVLYAHDLVMFDQCSNNES